MNNKITIIFNNDFKVEHYETCVTCNRGTEVPIDLHVDYRHNYVEGVGQLCHECFSEIDEHCELT
jgi:hypothetical protein